MGVDVSTNSVMGAAAGHLAVADVPDNLRHEIGKQMGQPTNILPDGQDINTLQQHPHNHRFYRNGLSTRVSTNNNPSSNTLASASRPVNSYISSMGGAAASRGSQVAHNSMVQGNNGAIGGACRPRGTEPATPVRRDGVPPKRVKKKLRKMALQGTPSTAAAAAETLEDIAAGTINAA